MRAAALAVILAACHSEPSHHEARATPIDATVPDATRVDATVMTAAPPEAPAPRRTLSLTLMSTPSGADVEVDHARVGKTPVYWQGPFTGAPRTFTFTLPGYKVAEYTFIPTTDGFVHPTLVPGGEDDGGVPALSPDVDAAP